MEYARLGTTGMQVSRICLGCMGFGDAARWLHKWVLDEENSRPVIRRALELGGLIARAKGKKGGCASRVCGPFASSTRV